MGHAKNPKVRETDEASQENESMRVLLENPRSS
jgi:hypothetical protein